MNSSVLFMFCITCPSLLYNFLLVITNTHFRILLLQLHGHVMQLGWKMVFVDSLTSRIPFPSFQQHHHTSFLLYHQAELRSLFKKAVSIIFTHYMCKSRQEILTCTSTSTEYVFELFQYYLLHWILPACQVMQWHLTIPNVAQVHKDQKYICMFKLET